MRRAAALLALLLLPTVAIAASGDVMTEEAPMTEATSSSSILSGTATLTIEQVALSTVQGWWLLAVPDQTQRSGSGATETLEGIPSGNYIIYGNLPSGTKTTIRIYNHGELDHFYERQQTPFTVLPGDELRIVIHYHLDKTGVVSVESDPAGTVFTLTGPDGATYAGTTPQFYEDLPEGQYKLQYESFAQGCVKPAPKAGQLLEDGRLSFTILFDCDAAEKVRERTQKDSAKYLTIVVNGEDVQLQDVLQKDWFSQYVFEAAKRDILSGYRDAEGNLTGTFGPGNSVTVAELSKIAHRMAGISEESFKSSTPKNPVGAGQWFSAFLASSESRSWVIYADGTIDPTRAATRAEVVTTLLQAFDVPLRWQKGNVFTDVSVSHAYAAAIETAAGDKIVSGRTDDKGVSLGIFDPDAPVTRAEIAKIITTILATYKSPTATHNAARDAN